MPDRIIKQKKMHKDEKMIIIGIDEAGRGPVIGPMVIAGFGLDESKIGKLKQLGVKDSKLLSPKKREQISEKLFELSNRILIKKLSPEEIDQNVLSKKSNLNLLEMRTTAAIIDALKPDRVIVDCPTVNEKKYRNMLKATTNHKCEIIAENKADFNYEIVGAASIIAKVARDREIEDIKKSLGKETGSGYPSDPKTKKFLKENYIKHKDIFRKSWSTYQRLVDSEKQESLKTYK